MNKAETPASLGATPIYTSVTEQQNFFMVVRDGFRLADDVIQSTHMVFKNPGYLLSYYSSTFAPIFLSLITMTWT